MSAFRQIANCRICGSADLTSILHLGTMALTGVFPKTPTASVTSGPIELVKCNEADGRGCGLVQLAHSYAFDEMYGDNYGYRSGLNASMIAHLGRKVDRIVGGTLLDAGDVVIDIGSNDATLLKAYPPLGLARIGVDPTGRKFKSYYPPDVTLVEDFFSAKVLDRLLAGRKARVVTSIAMFYDLESPFDFAADVRAVLADDGVWIFEQAYLPTMIDRCAYDTICHEHLEFYCLQQIKWIADRAGFKIVDVELNDVNGGSFSVTVAKRESRYPEATARVQQLLGFEADKGMHQLATYTRFAETVRQRRETLCTFVRDARFAGQTIYGYGASTKGNVLLQHCGFTSQDIAAIADVNEDKHGCFTPGTKIPIVSEATMRMADPHYLLVLPWHFRDGFLRREAAYLRGGGRLVFPLPTLTIAGPST